MKSMKSQSPKIHNSKNLSNPKNDCAPFQSSTSVIGSLKTYNSIGDRTYAGKWALALLLTGIGLCIVPYL